MAKCKNTVEVDKTDHITVDRRVLLPVNGVPQKNLFRPAVMGTEYCMYTP